MLVAIASAAAELAVVVPDTATAIVPITQFAPDPAVVGGLAHCAQVIAAHVDARASLGVVAERDRAATTVGARQVSVVIHDVADAAVEIERAGDPIAADILAAGSNLVTTHLDVAARLAVGATRAVATPVVAVVIPVAALIGVADQLSINVGDPRCAAAEARQ